ncbi:MAG: type II toxin-antitoxin system death-on-curing family toxin, partial [Nitrosomonas sp. PRO5]|nr:type II toxin-antitoxin system death-on-curing family toxin [Nitrosomonas sp. PRO5]
FTAGEEDSTQAVFSLAKGLLDESGFRLFIEDNSIAP